MVDVLSEIEIARPRAEVAAYAADPDLARSWCQNIKSVSWRTPPPAGAGTRVTFVAEFLGRELIAGRRLAMSTADGPFPMETTYTWEDAAEGATKMTLRNRGGPAGFSRIATPCWRRRCGAPIARTCDG